MAVKVLKILLFNAVIIFLCNCAQVGVLNGGARDVTPPKLIAAKPEMSSLNFNSENIVLKFDEYIQLKDITNQLIISPKLDTKPEIEVNGKTLNIHLKKTELKPNTTYRIYFGKAIADMHEGNVLNNFSYIFSTGNTIDSLNITGNVYNAYKGNAENDVLVGLYLEKYITDSAAFKQIPDYVCRTDNSGNFEFTNLPYEKFKLLCYTDKNKDMHYNGPPAESVGFYKGAISLIKDTAVKIALFNETEKKYFVKKVVQNEFGQAHVIFNQNTKSTIIPYLNKDFENVKQLNKERISDTCTFLYRGIKDSLWIKVSYGNNQTDTLKLKLPKTVKDSKYAIKLSNNSRLGFIDLNEKPVFVFNKWLNRDKCNLMKIHLQSKTDTSINKEQVKIKWLDENSFALDNKLKNGSDYSIRFDSLAITDYNNNYNDTVRSSFYIRSQEDYGKINFKLKVNRKQSYLVQLIGNNNTVVKEKSFSVSLSSSNLVSIDFTDVLPDTYKIRIVFDDNDDKKWNTGNYLNEILPEKSILVDKAIKLMPEWEIEEEFLIKD